MFHRFALSMILLLSASSLMTAYGQEKIKFEHQVNKQHYCLVLLVNGNQLFASQCNSSDSDWMYWTMNGLIRNEGYSGKCLTGDAAVLEPDVNDCDYTDEWQYFVPVPLNGHYYLYNTMKGFCVTLDPDNQVGDSFKLKWASCGGDDEKHQRIKLDKYPNSFWKL